MTIYRNIHVFVKRWTVPTVNIFVHVNKISQEKPHPQRGLTPHQTG